MRDKSCTYVNRLCLVDYVCCPPRVVSAARVTAAAALASPRNVGG